MSLDAIVFDEGPFARVDEESDEDVEETDEFVRLPKARPGPRTATLQSHDTEVRTCEHELARALEQVLAKEPVRLFEADVEFQEFARKVMAELHSPKCPIRGR